MLEIARDPDEADAGMHQCSWHPPANDFTVLNTIHMSESELQVRIETLEIRLAHQEAAMDEMTRTLLEQERLLREQSETLRRLEAQLRASVPSLIASRDEEVPPPHY